VAKVLLSLSDEFCEVLEKNLISNWEIKDFCREVEKISKEDCKKINERVYKEVRMLVNGKYLIVNRVYARRRNFRYLETEKLMVLRKQIRNLKLSIFLDKSKNKLIKHNEDLLNNLDYVKDLFCIRKEYEYYSIRIIKQLEDEMEKNKANIRLLNRIEMMRI
jgi:hypothetical protein